MNKMNRKTFEKVFSEKRLEKYFRRYNDDDKAMLHYQSNIELSECFYQPIAWNMEILKQMHSEIFTVMTWMNKDIPLWIAPFDRFEQACETVEKRCK
ncbi:hypothetical protein AGMMS49525_07530 [Bacteroidia bacterium]|nr:hypothetical protein AGMMS49525_07530 [Bacteroidia bacterium]